MSTFQPTPFPAPDGRLRFAVLAQGAAAAAAVVLALVYHTVILALSIRDGCSGTSAAGRVRA